MNRYCSKCRDCIRAKDTECSPSLSPSCPPSCPPISTFLSLLPSDSEIQNTYKCIICFDTIKWDEHLQCSVCKRHFCENCLKNWLKYNPICPHCRTNCEFSQNINLKPDLITSINDTFDPLTCKDHNKICGSFCQTCSEGVCYLCCFSHNSHSIVPLSDQLQSALKCCKNMFSNEEAISLVKSDKVIYERINESIIFSLMKKISCSLSLTSRDAFPAYTSAISQLQSLPSSSSTPLLSVFSELKSTSLLPEVSRQLCVLNNSKQQVDTSMKEYRKNLKEIKGISVGKPEILSYCMAIGKFREGSFVDFLEVDVEGENDGWFYCRMEVKQGATKEFDLQEVYRVKKGKNEFIGKFKVSSNMGDQEKIKIDLEIWRENDGIKRFRKQQLKIIQKQINEIVKNYEDD